MKPGTRVMHGQVLVVGAELEPNPSPPSTSSLRGPVAGGGLTQRPGPAPSRGHGSSGCSASAHVLRAANENARKSKPNRRKTNPARIVAISFQAAPANP
jgi:hypothetical protein